MEYNPKELEQKWQKKWADAKVFEADLNDTNKAFVSMPMLPYPSGDKLHLGHWYNYSGADVYSRFKKLHGYNVFSPIGYDSFGLPAENYAIKTGVHPKDSIEQNTATMTEQIKRMGCMFDWSKTLKTSHPDYYKWTQWLWLKMWEQGLAYRKEARVNFCPSCQTVLANEQVQNGKCERCGNEVEQKLMNQWFWRITDYADELITGLEELDWPEKTKIMQRNWIGRSTGCNVTWQIEGTNHTVDTFTTTVDTIYGVTFAVISPEHPLVLKITSDSQLSDVKSYIKNATKRSELERMADDKKTGVDTGAMLVHPLNGKKIPLWIADYVLMSYGTGVVMGVPAHDQRDNEFAQTYNFPVIQSIQNEAGESFVYDDIDKYTAKGTIINSDTYSGLSILEGRKKITEDLERAKKGSGTVQFRLRDWSIGRQRYWGAPIPMVFDPEGNPHPVPEEYLPWELPTDVEFKPTGTAPLAQSKELKERTEKIFGKGWTPEVDTMDTFVCSSFYQLRYLAGGNSGDQTQFIPSEVDKAWNPVRMYVGGAEHACMHLIYTRFVSMVLADAGVLHNREPFKRLIHQGFITKDGAKMSKSKGNVVSPDEIVSKYGSDILRMYLMFMGPYTEGGDWNDTGINGIVRFYQRVANLPGKVSTDSDESVRALHKSIKQLTNDYEVFQFNTAVASLMECINVLEKQGFSTQTLEQFIVLLVPLAPHLAEELWEQLGGTGFAIEQYWPTFDESKLIETTVTIAVQINGKVRGEIQVDAEANQDEVLAAAKAEPNVQKYLEGNTLKKEIYVPGKLVSLVL